MILTFLLTQTARISISLTLQRFRVRHGLSCGRNFELLRVKRVIHTWRCTLCKKLVCVCNQVDRFNVGNLTLLEMSLAFTRAREMRHCMSDTGFKCNAFVVFPSDYLSFDVLTFHGTIHAPRTQLSPCLTRNRCTAFFSQSVASFCHGFWLKVRAPAWAVANQSSGQSAMGTVQKLIFKTLRLTG